MVNHRFVVPCFVGPEIVIKDVEFLTMLESFSFVCDIRQNYKTEPGLALEFLLVKFFNGIVAMDLKDIKGHKILYMVDHVITFTYLKQRECLVSWVIPGSGHL